MKTSLWVLAVLARARGRDRRRRAGTRGAATTSGSTSGQVTVFKGVPGGLALVGPDRRAPHRPRARRPPARRRSRRWPTSRLLRRSTTPTPSSRRLRAAPTRHHPTTTTVPADPRDRDDHDDDARHLDHGGGPVRPMRSPVARRRRAARSSASGSWRWSSPAAATCCCCSPTSPTCPPDLWVFLLAVLGLYLVAHLAVRRFAPRADPTLLPIAALLNGIGFVTISRLDRDLARVQAVWTAVGVAAFVLTLIVVRHIRTLERYKYTFLLLGIAALLLPLLPGIGQRDQRRAAVGAHRAAELPARRDRQGAARGVLRRLPRRQARAARVGHAPHRASRAPRPQAPRAAAPRVGLLDPGDGPPEGPRLVAAVLRGVRRDALHRNRARRRTCWSRSGCSSAAR